MAMMISWVAPVHPSHPYLENDPAPSFAPTICAFHLGFSLVKDGRGIVTMGQAAGSTMGQAAGSTMGQAAGSTMGQAAGSTMGQAAGSTMGQAAGSTTGQAAASPLVQVGVYIEAHPLRRTTATYRRGRCTWSIYLGVDTPINIVSSKRRGAYKGAAQLKREGKPEPLTRT